MRTTIDIPDTIFRKVKATAVLEGKTLKTFLLEALTHELANRTKQTSGAARIKLPLVKSNSPGSLRITGDSIALTLEAEDKDVFAGH